MSTSSAVIRTENLTKRYGDHLAVDGLNLEVRQAEIYGFLGPNGAGKTTTIHMLLNLTPPTQGRVFVFGKPIETDSFEFRREIGVVAEEPPEPSKMTGWELVRYFARLYGVSKPDGRLEELFHALDLWDARQALARDYSRGMRQKLSLIRALVHEPRLLILDEPISGLDPHGIRQVRELIADFQQRGGTVFVSSHILSEVERSAHRVGILHEGRLLAEDSLAGLRKRLSTSRKFVVELETVPSELVVELTNAPYVLDLHQEGRQIELSLDDQDDVRPAIFHMISQFGGVIVRMEREEASLEEAFVTLTTSNVTRMAGKQS